MKASNDEIRQYLLRSFDTVGTSKAIGYIPLPAVSQYINSDISAVSKEFESKGFSVIIKKEDETRIKGGALFIYDKSMIDKALLNHGYTGSFNDFILRITTEWLDEDDPLMRIVKYLYGD